MKNRWNVATLITLAGIALPALAQTKAEPTKADQPAVKVKDIQPDGKPVEAVKPGPYTPTITTQDGRLNFAATETDFGTISDETIKEAEFKFTNNGSGPLEITNTQGSCGCTIGTLDKRVFQPGETGSIKVTFNPAHKRDQQHTTVTVSSNDSTKPQTVLNIKSFVKPLVALEPNFAMLNQVPKGKGGKATVTVTSRVEGLKILSATPSVAYFDAKVSEPRAAEVNGEKVTQWDLEISAKPDAPVGPINGGIMVRTSDEKRVLTVTATGEVIGDVMVSPPRIQLAGLTPDQPINAQFTLKSRNGQAFTVSKIDDAPVGARAFSKIDIKEDTSTTPPSYLVTLTGTASVQGGQISGQLLVRTNIKGEEEIKVPYYGYVRAAAPKATPTQTKGNSVWDENPSTLVPAGPR